jgi:DNA-binding CsgD family transcriptional regulator
MTPRTPENGGVIARPAGSLNGLPQFIRYASTYPPPADMLKTLKAGLLRQRGMSAAFLWTLVDGAQLVSVAAIGWSRGMVDRYSVLPMEVNAPAVQCVRHGVPQIDDVQGFGQSYLASVDNAFLTEQFEKMAAKSALNVPIRQAGLVLGVLGFTTSLPWVDDDESRALLESLSSLLGLWMSHPRSATSDASPSLGHREWSLAFPPRQRQVLRMAGEGMSNSDIARELLVSTSSVKQDLQQAMRALRSHDRATAFQRAIQLGLLD